MVWIMGDGNALPRDSSEPYGRLEEHLACVEMPPPQQHMASVVRQIFNVGSASSDLTLVATMQMARRLDFQW